MLRTVEFRILLAVERLVENNFLALEEENGPFVAETIYKGS